MKDQILAAWRSISVAQSITLAGLFATLGFVIVRMPAETWQRIAEKDPSELGAGVGLFCLAVYGVFASPKAPTP